MSYRCTAVDSHGRLPGLPSRRPSVTNSNTSGRVASVTTDRSDHRATLPSEPVVKNSVPTPAGPDGASIVSSRVVSSWRRPAQSRWLCRSASRSYTASGDAGLDPSNRSTGFRHFVRGAPRCSCAFDICLASSRSCPRGCLSPGWGSGAEEGSEGLLISGRGRGGDVLHEIPLGEGGSLRPVPDG